MIFLSAAVVAAVGWREHRQLRLSRRSLLDTCADVLDDGRIEHGADDFPRLTGHWHRRLIRAELVPDTMTIRRLPQLWLSLTVIESLPIASALAILVRPSGNDFYSLTNELDHTLEPPLEVPWEVLARGSSERAQQLLDSLAGPIGRILSDPRVKEIGITRKGLRLVWQASEGRRGEHLILRQAIFDDAAVSRGDFEQLMEVLDRLVGELDRLRTGVAA